MTRYRSQTNVCKYFRSRSASVPAACTLKARGLTSRSLPLAISIILAISPHGHTKYPNVAQGTARQVQDRQKVCHKYHAKLCPIVGDELKSVIFLHKKTFFSVIIINH